MQLPTFAFPPDPLLLALVPTALTVEQEKSRATVRGGPVASVQPRDALNRRCKQFVISRHCFQRCVCPVGEERETQIAIWIREVVHFQPLDLLLNLSVACQEGRYGYQC